MLKRIMTPLVMIGFLGVALLPFDFHLVDQAIAQRGLGASSVMRQQQRQQMQRQRQQQQQMRRQREQQAQRQRQMTRQREMRRQRQLAQQKQMKQRQIAQRRQREQARKRQQSAQRSRQASNGTVAVAATARRAGGTSATKPMQGAPSRVEAKRGARLAALKNGSKAPPKPSGANAKATSASGGGKRPPGGSSRPPAPGGSPPKQPPKLTPVFNAAARNTLASRAKIVGDRLRNLKGKVLVAKPVKAEPAKKSVGMSGKAANMPHEFKRAGSPAKSDGAKQRAPYAKLSRAREIVLKRDRTFVRVHGKDNQKGSWILRSKDIKGLTPAQIKEKFALPETPKFVSQVKVPAGTRMRVGTVAGQKGWGGGGKTQYELKGEHLPSSAFGKTKPLPPNAQ